METAILGTGCFWCTEAIFGQLHGVLKVVSGYSGGHVPNPSYQQVCSKNTGHAECLKIEYDAAQISFEELLSIFFSVHNPTTLNKQGADEGSQYRSVIFYLDDNQKTIAQNCISALNKAKVWDNPIVTTIEKFEVFYAAEDYHQNYFNNNPEQSYCQFVVSPKVEKFRNVFADKLKK